MTPHGQAYVHVWYQTDWRGVDSVDARSTATTSSSVAEGFASVKYGRLERVKDREKARREAISEAIYRMKLRGQRDRARPRRDASKIVYEVVPLPVAGSFKKRFSTYADAQRYAWDCLRKNDRFDLAKIKILGLDGKWREMENWTIGSSGKFRHAYPVSGDRSRKRR